MASLGTLGHDASEIGWSETLWSPESPHPVMSQFDIYFDGSSSWRRSDEQTYIAGIRCKAWFNTGEPEEAERLFAFIETGTIWRVGTANRTRIGPFQVNSSAPCASWSVRNFEYRFIDRLCVYAREPFEIHVEFSKTAMEYINEATMMRSFTVSLIGIVVRDAA